MGRKKIPTTLKILRGNPGKRRIDPEAQPDGVPVDQEPPDWLCELALEKWHETFPVLQRAGLVTQADVTALACYCQCYAEFRRAKDWLDQNGRVMVLRDDKGNVKYRQPAPEFSIMKNMLADMRKYEASFGMTPSARAGLPGSGAVAETPKIASRTRGA